MDKKVWANTGHATGQMAKAFVTALTHEDPETRVRAEERLRRWERVASGMRRGSVDVGSRTPVKGLPAWATPEVVRGGFATGDAAAGGPLLEYEVEAAHRAGVPAERCELFMYYLTDPGLDELHTLLDSGRFEVVVPEEAALLVVAWLLRAGDRDGALDVLETIGPFADRLRFLPRPGKVPGDSSLASRETVGAVMKRIAAKRPNTAVATMNEALSVWNPFGDELLEHWLETVRDGRVLAEEPDGWRERGTELLARYKRLATTHELCGKHRRPKENLAILRTSLDEVLGGGRPSRLLQHAVDSMVAKRDVPGAAEHAALRETQAAIAARPTHHAVAQVVAARLRELPQDTGVPSIEPFVAPVIDGDRRSELPESIRSTVENALQAPVTTLVERGIVPSAEVLAELVPQLVASTSALSYQDPALRGLMTAAYRAFRNRRSLLLLNLEHQVRLSELPWVQAVENYRRTDRVTQKNAHTVLVQLAELTLHGFPGTIVPNPMVSELSVLAHRADRKVPFVEELAADIFMGTFSPKFLRAAQLAGEVLEGTVYERYYGIDYAAVRALRNGFGELCTRRADTGAGRSWIAANGAVIEQAQILTTHNLAALVHPVGVDPTEGWDGLARRAFSVTCRLVRQVHGNPRPLSTIKDAAYAWRQALFFLALCSLKDQFAVVASMQDELERHPAHVVRRLDPVLAGLRHVLVGGSFDGASRTSCRRFLGWTTGKHWMTS